MAKNKTKVDRLHDQLNPFFNTRNNPNWAGLIEAIGDSDQMVADLIVAVAQQFFIKTASRPYLDRLAANVGVSRPPFIGMDDPTFRTYIPVLSYQPKQVKAIVDALLDIFFAKQSTTAHVQSGVGEPFALVDGWELKYTIDGYKHDTITFFTGDFANIAAATAEEVAAAINRQVSDSFAVPLFNPITGLTYVQLFTNTIGSKGSVTVTGGRADIALQFNGFLTNTALGNNTQWTVSKVGDLITFQWTGGITPNLFAVQAGDTFISDLPGSSGNLNNIGSFLIESVDLSSNSFTFRNLFGFPGVFTQTNAVQTAFITNYRAVVWTNNPDRAVTWEVLPNQFTVEMPTSPPVVRRSLMGSAHINGLESLMTDRVSDTEITLNNITNWPVGGGTFFLQGLYQIQGYIASQNTVSVLTEQSNLIYPWPHYTYTGISGNNLVGISPPLPSPPTINYAFTIPSSTVNAGAVYSNNGQTFTVITAISPGTTLTANGTGLPTLTGTLTLVSGVGPSTITFTAFEDIQEFMGLADSGSTVILDDALSASITGIKGPYVWDTNAPFVLSSYTGDLTQTIFAGQSFKLINIGPNNLPTTSGQIIFDFGTSYQEGPVNYLFAPSSTTLAIDPAYVFKYNHAVGSAVTAIRNKGPIVFSGTGAELAPYITDPSQARLILEGLIREVASAGIFIEFLIRYPQQLYSLFDVYNQDGNGAGAPFESS